MPIFEIQDPQGRTLEIDGDHEPTADELRKIFSQAFPTEEPAAPTPPTAQSPAAAPQEEPLTKSWIPEFLLPQQRLATPPADRWDTRPLLNVAATPQYQLLEAAAKANIPGTRLAKAAIDPGKALFEGFTSPENLAVIPAGIAAPEIVGPAFAAMAIPSVVQGAKNAYAGFKAGNLEQAVGGASEAITSGATAALGLAGLRARPAGEARALAYPPENIEIPASAAAMLPRAAAEIAIPPKFRTVEQEARRAAIKAARPVVPETAAEAERGLSVIEEIRAKGADTKEKIRALFPQLSRETAAKLRDQAFPKAKIPDNLSKTDVDRLFLEKLNEQSNQEIQNASRIREDAGQVPPRGNEPQSGEGKGGENLERRPSGQPGDTGAQVQKEAQAQPAVEDLAPEVVGFESNDSIVQRTAPGAERDAAFANRAKALKQVALTLKPGDVIVTDDGGRLVVDQVMKDGTIFAYKEGSKAKGGQVGLSPDYRIERQSKPAPAAPEQKAQPAVGTVVTVPYQLTTSSPVHYRDTTLIRTYEGTSRTGRRVRHYVFDDGVTVGVQIEDIDGNIMSDAVALDMAVRRIGGKIKPPPIKPEAAPPTEAPTTAVVSAAKEGVGETAPSPSAIREATTPPKISQPPVEKRWFNASHQEQQQLVNRPVTSVDSLGTWVTSSAENAKTLYGPNVYQVEVPPNLRLLEFDGSDPSQIDFNRVIGANAQLAREAGFTKEAKILDATLPDTRRYSALNRKANLEGLRGVEFEEFKRLKAAENASRTLLRSGEYMQRFKAFLQQQGYDGILWKNSRIDTRPSDPAHDVAVIFHKEPLKTKATKAADVGGASEARTPVESLPKPLGGTEVKPTAEPTPTPGAQPYDPGTQSLGIVPPVPKSLRVFAQQDVGPFLRKGVDLVKATKDAIINAFSPATHAKVGDVDILFKSKGYAEKVMTQAGAVLEHANNLLKAAPRAEQIAFIDRVKRGQPQPTPELQDIADLLRNWDDRLWSEARVYKPTLAYLDNHMRVLWKTIPGSARRGTSQQQILSKRPWRGSQGFTRKHVLDDMSQGIALGGEPVTYNPVEMFLLHAQDVMKFVSANQAWESLKGTGEVTYVKFGKKAPDDFVRINDSIAKAYFSPAGTKGIRAQAGEWWVQKDAARMIENYLSRDWIRSNPIGRALMGLKNATTAIELGLSPFHAVFESLETMGSSFGLGLSKIMSGDVVAGLKNVAGSVVSPKTVSKIGRAGIKYAKDAAGFQAAEPEAYNWFLSKFPDARRLIDDLFTGGGQIGMHQDYKWKAGTGFNQALQEGNYPGAVLRALPALNQTAMKPLFEIYIPRLKVGTFLREYAFELDRNAPAIAAGRLSREQLARKTWAFVEDRFGEMNFDNLYWDRTFKSALQLAFRSVTWKLGNLRGFGKAARDATAELGWRWYSEGRPPQLTLPMAWALGMSVTTATISSLISKAATGKYPWELAEDAGDLVKNLVFPRISLTDPSQRVSTPTYWRDAVHLSHSVPDYIKSSMSGEKGRITDVWNNRDFYGTQVFNPDDPLPQKVSQAMQHLVPVPFGASSWLAAERTGATRGQALAGFFGFTKAPYYVSHTAAEQKATELMRAKLPQGSRTREEFERSIRERQAVEAIKRGDMTIQEAVRDGLVDQARASRIQQRASQPLLENVVGRLSASDAVRVYAEAQPNERDRIKFPIQQKILNSKTLSASQKGDLLVELEK